MHLYEKYLYNMYMQTLHLCIVTAGEWRWTKPFSMAAEGSRAVTAYIGRHIAVVNVCITNIGGLQRKVCSH